MKKFRLFSFIIIMLFISINVVNASTTGTVMVDDDLNVRNSVGGDYVTSLFNGNVVTITNLNAGSTSTCSVWYEIKYGNYDATGYVCGEYINLLKGYVSCSEDSEPLNVWSDINRTTHITTVGCDLGMTILDKDAGSNEACSNWYKVDYNGQVGYSCGAYLYTDKKENNNDTGSNNSSSNTGTSSGSNTNGSDIYGRPWTSPKKAIEGGAIFIAENYISKGQYTSYLKKFNVNPNSSYPLFNHQYMANLQAPSQEAYSSYTSYLNNGLLELPLTFVIPVFNNMPDVTVLPGKEADVSGQEEITDEAFEAKLNEQNFPDSYKKKLRLLHSKYSNWTFIALHTNVDFNTAVSREQVVSSISLNTSYFEDYSGKTGSCRGTLVSGKYCMTEKGWYIANQNTVAYFLDPRNFLNEIRILQFENLGYSSNYTEEVVQTILNKTFMEGKSACDDQSYASIFVEAGRKAGASPVYLASLSKQEVGANGSVATSGQIFTYKGTTYKWLYNFYNIGAYSEEESPVKAGLVYASGGDDSVITTASDTDTKVCPVIQTEDNDEDKGEEESSDTTNKDDDNDSSQENGNDTTIKEPEKEKEEEKIVAKPMSYYLSKLGVNNKDGYITGLSLGTTVNTITNIKEDVTSITVKNVSGEEISGDNQVGTGSVVTINNGLETSNYTVITYGDVNGDGKITASDYMIIKDYILGKKTLGVVNGLAADANKSGNVAASDYLIIRDYILGKISLSQA